MSRGNLIAIMGGVVLAGAFAYAQVANSNYMKQGGTEAVIGGQLDVGEQGVALTSPTVTFSVVGKSFITLTADQNLTGIKPISGVTGQVVQIRSGAGSNTLRFDDSATTMSLGGNITLTEGQDDVITLVCTGVNAVSGNNTWACVSAHDN